MATDAVRAALAWRKVPGLSPRRFWRACARAGAWTKLPDSDPSLFGDILPSERTCRELTRPFDIDVSSELAAAREAKATLLTPFEGPYPRLLREIPDAPLVLYARGDLGRLSLPAVGIVGARAATNYGKEVCARLAHDLSSSGVCVVSGMARGIDAAAHLAALGGPGGTVAVQGCGPELPYPEDNRALWDRICLEGLVLTEFSPGTEPEARNFPVRNRIIAGMSSGVVVVEAATRSGSLITAKFANDFGRDVFAVPGSVRSELSDGCHVLLRDGAILCRGAEDVLSEIFPSLEGATAAPGRGESLSGEAAQVWKSMAGEESWSADDLAEVNNLPVANLLAILFDLEARGFLRTLPGGLFVAIRDTTP
ncbi:MAG: DNA-processing protein DprA [Thermoanaerobaculia bacterium]